MVRSLLHLDVRVTLKKGINFVLIVECFAAIDIHNILRELPVL